MIQEQLDNIFVSFATSHHVCSSSKIISCIQLNSFRMIQEQFDNIKNVGLSSVPNKQISAEHPYWKFIFLSTFDKLTVISAKARREALFSFNDFLPKAGKNLLRLSWWHLVLLMTGTMLEQTTFIKVGKYLCLVFSGLVAIVNIVYFFYLHRNYNNNACYMFLKIEAILTCICQTGIMLQ